MKSVLGLVAAAIFFVLPAVAQAPEDKLMRATARLALQAGDFQTADTLSAALLSNDVQDADAWLIRAAVARATGRVDVWAEASAAAYDAAETDFQRFDAAMMAAQAAAQQERYTTSQFWLRRADQYAPQGAQNAVAQAYRQVSALNPLSLQLSFGFTPSNNVNDGGDVTTIEIGGLPFSLGDDAQPLGGYEATTGISLSYRLSSSKTQETQALLDIFGKKVWLDSEAKDIAPTADGSDYDYGAIIVGLRNSRLIWPDWGPSQITGLIGQSWSGGAKQALWSELRLSQDVRQGNGKVLRFGVSARDENRNDDPISDSVALGVSVDWTGASDAGRPLSLGASAKTTRSDSGAIDSVTYGVSAAKSLPDWGAIQPRLTANLETRDFSKWVTTPDGRRDDSLRLRLNIVHPEWKLYGFVPQASLTARRVWSNVDIYDRNSLSLGLTAVSRF